MQTKKILMIAKDRKVEALRMASGLTLLDDEVSVLVWGELEESNEANEQLDALDFSDVVVDRIALADAAAISAERIAQSDVVYMI